MEQWEHMMVVAMVSGHPQFVTFPANAAAADAGEPSASSTINLLNELGSQGWQLVSADSSDDRRTGTYWLKRRVLEQTEHEPGGWVTSV
jgi:hypothetical protein